MAEQKDGAANEGEVENYSEAGLKELIARIKVENITRTTILKPILLSAYSPTR